MGSGSMEFREAFQLLYWPYCYSFRCLCGPQSKSGSDTRFVSSSTKKRLPVGPVIVVCHNNASGVLVTGFVGKCVCDIILSLCPHDKPLKLHVITN